MLSQRSVHLVVALWRENIIFRNIPRCIQYQYLEHEYAGTSRSNSNEAQDCSDDKESKVGKDVAQNL